MRQAADVPSQNWKSCPKAGAAPVFAEHAKVVDPQRVERQLGRMCGKCEFCLAIRAERSRREANSRKAGGRSRQQKVIVRVQRHATRDGHGLIRVSGRDAPGSAPAPLARRVRFVDGGRARLPAESSSVGRDRGAVLRVWRK